MCVAFIGICYIDAETQPAAAPIWVTLKSFPGTTQTQGAQHISRSLPCRRACCCLLVVVVSAFLCAPTGHPHSPNPTTMRVQGEVVEGSDSEIRAAFFVVAVTREYNEALGRLEWRIVELSMQGSMLYL